MYWRFFFIWLVILFVFTYSFVFILFIYFAVNVMSFRVLTVHCQISPLVAIMSIKEKEKKKKNRLADYGVVNFRCVQIWLVMSMQFIFGDDLKDAPYWSRFASLAIFMFLNKLTQSIRKQIEKENYFKRDISRPSIKKEATLLQRRIRRVRKQGNSNSRELRYYVSQNNYLKQFVELYSNIDSMSMAESLCCMYLIARSSQLWRC